MEVSNKTIVLFLLTIFGYVYLADVFNKPSVQQVYII